MSTVSALYPVLITDRLKESADFYADLLGLQRVFAADWFVQLAVPGNGTVQMGLVARGHDSIPARFREASGVAALLTVEVANADEIYERALEWKLPIELGLRSEVWGQRHFITTDPNDCLVDVVQVIPVTSAEAAAQYLA